MLIMHSSRLLELTMKMLVRISQIPIAYVSGSLSLGNTDPAYLTFARSW
jgi:hypothetical protein